MKRTPTALPDARQAQEMQNPARFALAFRAPTRGVLARQRNGRGKTRTYARQNPIPARVRANQPAPNGLPALALDRPLHRLAHVGGAFGDFDAGGLQGGDLFGGGAFAAAR